MDPNLIAGTLELMTLDVLAKGENYGYQIAQLVFTRSGGLMDLKEGSLYPALHRMERRGLVESRWVEPDRGRRRKYYRITAEGKAARKRKRNEWSQFSKAISGVLGVKYGVA